MIGLAAHPTSFKVCTSGTGDRTEPQVCNVLPPAPSPLPSVLKGEMSSPRGDEKFDMAKKVSVEVNLP
jgi:hypothetical protein